MNPNKTLNCPQCRQAIPQRIESVKVAGCPHCGCIATMHTDGYLHTYKTYSPLLGFQQDPFLLGNKMQYNGVEYTVYAIFKYAVKYSEFDEEDDRWENGNGFVTEWYARSAQNDYELMVMSDTDEKFYIVYDRAANPITDIYKDVFIEDGTFELSAFAGVDDAPLDEKGFYRAYKNDLFLESTEANFLSTASKAFSIQALSPTEVKRLHVINEADAVEADADFDNITFYRNLFAAALLVVLGLMLFSDGLNGGNKSVSMQNTEGVSDGQRVGFGYELNAKNELDTALIRPKRAGMFNLTAGRNYLFKAKCFLGSSYGNKDVDFSVSIIRQRDKAIVSDVDIAFFVESGRDDEGDWTETMLEDEFKFQVSESGVYEVFASPDYDDYFNTPPCSLTVSVVETPYYYFYLILGGGFLLALVVTQWRRENVVAFANLNHGTYLHDLFKQ